jgi:RimJ/RimL family protein N-acetyltransferase
MNIKFHAMDDAHVSLLKSWFLKKHVKDVWLIEGYATVEQLLQAKQGNGYDYPFIIYWENVPIGYVQACDLYAYRTECPKPKGLFTAEAPGTFCMDLFIGEENYLNRGYGTEIVKAFIHYIFANFNANKILIDPATSNQRAIRCYEKAGFRFVREEFDGITHCYIMQINNPNTYT